MQAQVNDECNSWFATTACALARMGHFEMDRIEAKKARVDSRGSTFKKPNVAQQTKPQQLQPAVAGLVPHSRLKKARNLDDLKVELPFRGMKDEEIPKSTSDRKSSLKQLEFKRLLAAGVEGEAAAEQAKQCFWKESTAPFKLNDD